MALVLRVGFEQLEECDSGWRGFAVKRRDEHEIAWYRRVGSEPDRAAAGHPDGGRRQERDADTESDQLDQVRDRVDLAGDAPPQSRGLAGSVDARPQRRVRAVFDEVEVGEVDQSYAAAAGERIVSGDPEQQRFGTDRPRPDAVGLRPQRQVDDRHLQLSVGGLVHERCDAGVMQPQTHGWMSAVIASE